MSIETGAANEQTSYLVAFRLPGALDFVLLYQVLGPRAGLPRRPLTRVYTDWGR